MVSIKFEPPMTSSKN